MQEKKTVLVHADLVKGSLPAAGRAHGVSAPLRKQELERELRFVARLPPEWWQRYVLAAACGRAFDVREAFRQAQQLVPALCERSAFPYEAQTDFDLLSRVTQSVQIHSLGLTMECTREELDAVQCISDSQHFSLWAAACFTAHDGECDILEDAAASSSEEQSSATDEESDPEEISIHSTGPVDASGVAAGQSVVVSNALCRWRTLALCEAEPLTSSGRVEVAWWRMSRPGQPHHGIVAHQVEKVLQFITLSAWPSPGCVHYRPRVLCQYENSIRVKSKLLRDAFCHYDFFSYSKSPAKSGWRVRPAKPCWMIRPSEPCFVLVCSDGEVFQKSVLLVQSLLCDKFDVIDAQTTAEPEQ